MANLGQSLDTTFQTPMLGQVTFDPQPGTIPAQIDPGSSATVIVAGCAVKVVAGAAPGPVVRVDVTSANTDGPVYGIIPYNLRKNVYSPGDPVEVCGRGSFLMLKTGGAVNGGDMVSATNPSVATNDPTVSTDTTAEHYLVGEAMTGAAGAGSLIKVQVAPGKNAASTDAVISANP